MTKRPRSQGVTRPPAPKDDEPVNLVTQEPEDDNEEFDEIEDEQEELVDAPAPKLAKPTQEAVAMVQKTATVMPTGGKAPNTSNDKAYAAQMKDALKHAKDADKGKPDDKRGWRTPFQMGIPGAAAKRIADSGAPLETRVMPNSHFFPETGIQYRLK